MNTLSMGWSPLYRHQRGELSEQYNELAATYDHTSRAVGDVRGQLMALATEAGIWPPITRQDVRLNARRRPEVEAIGGAAVELYVLQEETVAANRDAMWALRNEDNNIWSKARSNDLTPEQLELEIDPTTTEIRLWPNLGSAMTI